MSELQTAPSGDMYFQCDLNALVRVRAMATARAFARARAQGAGLGRRG